MKENVSIIFAAIIGTFLIVILPLYSILDRQDSMSYNVVLTATTNFVDNIRNNGFIDKKSYTDYIREIASTGNTYKVKIEAYKKVLIHETDKDGKVIPNSFVEEKEMYNTQDILKVIENEADNVNGVEDSNKKNSVYLFNEDDEIYVKVYNTNITAGSVIYSTIANVSNTKVIDISYGGVINKVNWELYEKIQIDTALAPQVAMSVPVNRDNSTNIKKLDITQSSEYIDCTIENLENYVGVTSIEELCADYAAEEGMNYTYLYDLSKTENKQIRIAVELRGFETINVGIEELEDGRTIEKYIPVAELQDLSTTELNKVKEYIIENYIRLNGMEAKTTIQFRRDNYYAFDIILTDVRMSTFDFISTRASVTVLAGLGQDKNHVLSLTGESIEIELIDETLVNTVVISRPFVWQKFLKTKSLTESVITNNIVYAKQEIAFMISYTGITNHSDSEIKAAINNNLRIFIEDATVEDFEIYTDNDLNNQYEINIGTETAGHVIVKFKYTASNTSNENHVTLQSNWISTNQDYIVNEQTGEEVNATAQGASSVNYQVLTDTLAPVAPMLAFEGTSGERGWYTSDVQVTLIPSKSDLVMKDGIQQVGGSGVRKNTITATGAAAHEETEESRIILSAEGVSRVVAKAEDYVGNVVIGERHKIQIDKTPPTQPLIEVVSGTEGSNNNGEKWYTSDVQIKITPGTDNVSTVDKTTLKIEGANELSETEATTYKLTKDGSSNILATTYDKAGNKSFKELRVNIDKAIPQDAQIEEISGEKNSPGNEWYVTNVGIKITVSAGDAVSGLGECAYKIGNGEVVKFSGNTKEITLDKNGTHTITVYTYTKAGRSKTTTHTIKIDKNAPNAPTLDIIAGDIKENDWYISPVKVKVTSNPDIGDSGTRGMMRYSLKADEYTEINNNTSIDFKTDGEYNLKVYSQDMAGNEAVAEKTIKLDTVDPIPAEFVIRGTKKDSQSEWYTSDVDISHKGGSDVTSGIQSIVLSQNKVNGNTQGTEVTLTTKDNAGHSVTIKETIKIDKTAPTEPVIDIAEDVTGNGITGVALYNKNITVSITPGEDNTSLVKKTTYEVTTNGGQTVIRETEGTSFTLSHEGLQTIIARTYNNAGMVTEVSTSVWINKQKPATPKILSINGVDVSEETSKVITDTNNTVELKLNNLTVSNQVIINLLNEDTHKETNINEIATKDGNITITLETYGKFRISVTQINMFGTISNPSSGYYTYEYKQIIEPDNEENEENSETEDNNTNNQ